MLILSQTLTFTGVAGSSVEALVTSVMQQTFYVAPPLTNVYQIYIDVGAGASLCFSTNTNSQNVIAAATGAYIASCTGSPQNVNVYHYWYGVSSNIHITNIDSTISVGLR